MKDIAADIEFSSGEFSRYLANMYQRIHQSIYNVYCQQENVQKENYTFRNAMIKKIDELAHPIYARATNCEQTYHEDIDKNGTGT